MLEECPFVMIFIYEMDWIWLCSPCMLFSLVGFLTCAVILFPRFMIMWLFAFLFGSLFGWLSGVCLDAVQRDEFCLLKSGRISLA